jgi:hypothetical protein
MLRQILGALLVLSLVSVPAVATPPEEFNAAVDFSTSIETLYRSMQEDPQATIDSTKSVILDGVVASVTVVDPSEQSFQAFVELVSGEWEGLEDVELYRTYVRVGPDFYNRISTRQNRRPSGEVIEQNSRVLVAGNIVGYLPDQTSSALIPAVDGFHIRDLP